MLACVGIHLLPVWFPLGIWYVFFVAVVCSQITCGSLLSFACWCPSYHTSFRMDGLESRRGLYGGGFVLLAVICSAAGTLVCGGSFVSLPALPCGSSYGLHGHTYWPLGGRRLIAHVCVLWCGVPFVFFCVVLCVWGPSSPCCCHTPFMSHGSCVLYVRGTCGRRQACSLVCDSAVVVVSLFPCVLRVPVDSLR